MFKFNKPTLITLTAPTCSGKSFLLNELTKRGLTERIVSTTTRPPRVGEVMGMDYDFVTSGESRDMEHNDEFFELITFNGIRYGVTNNEMDRKMLGEKPPVVVLEPKGLEIYRRECFAREWDIFQIYVHVVEGERIERLNRRTQAELKTATVPAINLSRMAAAFNSVQQDVIDASVAKIVADHAKRLQSIVGDERRWQTMFSWDAIVPGDNVEKAIEMIEAGIKWKNTRGATPTGIGRVELPLV